MSALSLQELESYRSIYRDGLLKNTLPFWLPRCIDDVHGGYLTALGEDGALLQTDKSVWFQARFAWILSTLYLTVEPRPEWLSYARHGIEFLQRHCFDTDGRMFFLVTREGRPLRKRRYCFSEMFTIIALASYGKAAGDDRCQRQAIELFHKVLEFRGEPKVNPETRPMKGLVMPMILLVTAQELRKATGEPICTEVIDRCVAEIERDFLKLDLRCLMETVGPSGEMIDTFDGRLINPGHAIEAGWFILEEARWRGGDAKLARLGVMPFGN